MVTNNRFLEVSLVVFFAVVFMGVGFGLGHSTSKIDIRYSSSVVSGSSSFKEIQSSPLNAWYEDAEQYLIVVPDILNKSEIHVFDDKVVLDGEYVRLSPSGTNSMLPLFGLGNDLLCRYTDGVNLSVGSIITFDVSWYDEGQYNTPVAHRIISVGSDEEGFYYITKGDNNPNIDSWRVRPENVNTLVTGVIY